MGMEGQSQWPVGEWVPANPYPAPLAWSTEVPTVEGWYIRYNIRISLHYLRDMDAEFPTQGFTPGELWLNWGEAGMKKVNTLPAYRWYGPIPNPK